MLLVVAAIIFIHQIPAVVVINFISMSRQALEICWLNMVRLLLCDWGTARLQSNTNMSSCVLNWNLLGYKINVFVFNDII